jgi:hypothetical protein
LIVLVLTTRCIGGQPAPEGYSCGGPSTGHCYAIASIGDHLTGFRSTIGVIANAKPGDGFVNNEFWLINYSGNGGWIEIGYQVNTVELPKYFWAVLDPDTGIFTNHNMDTIPQEEVGTRVTFDIHQIAEDTFAISVDGSKTHYSTTVQVNLWNGTYGGYIHIGQELSGSKDAIASLAIFVENQVYDSNFHHHYATEVDRPLDETLDRPPYGGWMQKPTQDNKGGVFSTYCCAP